MDSLGSRVKHLRKKKGLTQIQLGSLVGIHHTNIGRIENKKIMPQADVLYLIAKNLNTSVEWLLTGKTAHSAFDSINSASWSKHNNVLNELFDLCQHLTESEQKEVKKFVQFIIYQKTIKERPPNE